ncbi:MAG: hypothetical protein M3Q08_07770 [Pseudomonadota bacterium]|nr:hypothetical protein [Pseudomonadota bacterium]
MATRTAGAAPRPSVSLTPDRFDRLLSAAATILLLMVAAALWRGRSEWGEIPAIVWTHLVTILVALVLTPVMLLRRRGDRLTGSTGAWGGFVRGDGLHRCCELRHSRHQIRDASARFTCCPHSPCCRFR